MIDLQPYLQHEQQLSSTETYATQSPFLAYMMTSSLNNMTEGHAMLLCNIRGKEKQQL